jgi:N-acetylneuraminic acid mutarotase
MSHKRKTAILFGLCTVLAACDDTSTRDLTGPGISEAEGTELQSLSDSWAAKRSVSPYRIRMAAGAINDIIYVVGGIGIDWTTNRARHLARADAYKIATNSWSRVASMPRGREFPNGASAINGKLYVTGGIDNEDRPTKTLFVYDPMTNSWRRKADMPQPGCAGVQGVIDRKLYVYMFGCDRFSSDVVVRFYRYNPATDTWVMRALPPSQILSSSGGVIGGKFYIAAAYSGTREPTPLYVYDPVSNTWQTKASMSQPRHDMVGAVLNGKLFMVGGSDNFLGEDPRDPELEVYNPMTNSWATKTSLPFGTVEGAAVGVAGKVYYIIGRVFLPEGGERLPDMSEVYAYTP